MKINKYNKVTLTSIQCQG